MTDTCMRIRSTRIFAAALIAAAIAAGQAFAPTGRLTFDVASLKRSQPGAAEAGVRPAPGGRRYVGNESLRSYLYVAYQVRPEQIVGGPKWADSELYDLNAQAEAPSSIEDLHIMLQNLLTERFKLRFHFEAKEMQAYVLTVDKNGPKNLKVHPNASGGDVILERTANQLVHERWNAHCASMDFFVWRFSAWLDQPMINRTDLKGCFDFELEFTREPTRVQADQLVDGVPIDTSGPTIYQALQNQLGLKFESRKAPVETMVIDSAERPED
jgi:uncharacterized protein (TIGR03435 family)